MSKFNKGDKVRCTDATHFAYVKVGEEFEVREALSGGERIRLTAIAPVRSLRPGDPVGGGHAYPSNQFELVVAPSAQPIVDASSLTNHPPLIETESEVEPKSVTLRCLMHSGDAITFEYDVDGGDAELVVTKSGAGNVLVRDPQVLDQFIVELTALHGRLKAARS